MAQGTLVRELSRGRVIDCLNRAYGHSSWGCLRFDSEEGTLARSGSWPNHAESRRDNLNADANTFDIVAEAEAITAQAAALVAA